MELTSCSLFVEIMIFRGWVGPIGGINLYGEYFQIILKTSKALMYGVRVCNHIDIQGLLIFN